MSEQTSAVGKTPPATRRVKLRSQRVDPLSVALMSVLIAVALGIAGVVATAVLWMILNGMGVFSSVNSSIKGLLGASNKFDLMDYVGFTRVMSLSVALAVINVLLLTALATIGAFLYNISASLVGGVQSTFTDD